MSVSIEPTSITIDGKRIGMSVFQAIIDPDNRVLWAFVLKDGTIQAVPYNEGSVIWISEGRPCDS